MANFLRILLGFLALIGVVLFGIILFGLVYTPTYDPLFMKPPEVQALTDAELIALLRSRHTVYNDFENPQTVELLLRIYNNCSVK